MSSRWYPVFRPGNPQLRIFLPNFWLKLVHPAHKQPSNIVQFKAPTQMSDHDIKEYLEKIYKVPVAHVRSRIQEGKLKRQRTYGYVIKEPDFRRAFVTLQSGHTFDFPDITSDKIKVEEDEIKSMREQTETAYKEFTKKNKGRPGVPGWFSL